MKPLSSLPWTRSQRSRLIFSARSKPTRRRGTAPQKRRRRKHALLRGSLGNGSPLTDRGTTSRAVAMYALARPREFCHRHFHHERPQLQLIYPTEHRLLGRHQPGRVAEYRFQERRLIPFRACTLRTPGPALASRIPNPGPLPKRGPS